MRPGKRSQFAKKRLFSFPNSDSLSSARVHERLQGVLVDAFAITYYVGVEITCKVFRHPLPVWFSFSPWLVCHSLPLLVAAQASASEVSERIFAGVLVIFPYFFKQKNYIFSSTARTETYRYFEHVTPDNFFTLSPSLSDSMFMHMHHSSLSQPTTIPSCTGCKFLPLLLSVKASTEHLKRAKARR